MLSWFLIKKVIWFLLMELMDDAGMMDEKNLEYFRRVVEESRDEEMEIREEDKGDSYERKDNEKSF